jgi:hypothetical protein
MVLGGKSQVLEVGRKGRFHTEVMRIAMGVRDGGCTEEHCETPAGLCHAHHDEEWSAGGHTNVATGRLLCSSAGDARSKAMTASASGVFPTRVDAGR